MLNTPTPLNRAELAKFLPDKRAIKSFEDLFDLVPGQFNNLEVLVEETNFLAGTADSKATQAVAAISVVNDEIDVIDDEIDVIDGKLEKIDALFEEKIKFVYDKSDFPTAVSNVITLADNVTYFLTTFVDLTGDRILSGQNSVLIGGSSENCGLLSTGLLSTTALVTSEWSLPARNIKFTHGTVLDLDATGNADQVLDWYGVNFLNCAEVGTITAYENTIFNDMAFLDSGGLTFDGITNTISFTGSLFSCAAGQTSISIASTATVDTRFRITYSSFVTPATSTALDVSTSATIGVEGYILDTCDFSGAGTYITGVQFDDVKSRFVNCSGIDNSSSISNYYMLSNATATTIATVDTPVKVAGTTTSKSITQRFTNSSTNRATYSGVISRNFMCSCNTTFTSSNNNVIVFYIYKNGVQIADSKVQSTASSGGRGENITVQTIVALDDTDYIEFWCENHTGSANITVEDLNMIIQVVH
tara:strand:+ start:49 stop:1473 length:1425 start_codon:yes stop_codon:yes gene_type:complete